MKAILKQAGDQAFEKAVGQEVSLEHEGRFAKITYEALVRIEGHEVQDTSAVGLALTNHSKDAGVLTLMDDEGGVWKLQIVNNPSKEGTDHGD